MTAGQIAVVVAASFAGALVKAVTGLGYPVIAVPLIALVLGVEDAVVLVALPNLAANVYLNVESRDARHETRDLDLLVGFGIVGAIVGTIALTALPDEPLLLALAAMVGIFVVVFLAHPELSIDPRTARRGAPVVGALQGVAQGAVGVSGPIVATWVHGYRLSPRAYVNQVTFIFGITGFAQVVVLLVQGQFTAHRMLGAAVAGVAVAIATPLGLALRRRLESDLFQRVVLAVLLVSAGALVVQALA
ncbi:MAG: sulfite exporter TauE/SafE family protein [Actinobacteria bacterium]|nr:sulfite exporter TauE/SafE family protein [Actinomycetota bacterium]